MMPELGKYAIEVLASYAVSVALIVGLVWISIRRWRVMRDDLAAAEARRGKDG